MRKRIILFTHIPTRDNVTDQILVQRLRKNHDVYMWSFLNNPKEKVVFLKPHLIIVPEIRCEFARDFVRDVHEMGVQIVIRRGERGHSRETKWREDFNAAAFGNYPIYDYIDLDLVWGERFKEMLMKYHKQPESKFAVTGAFLDQYINNNLTPIKNTKPHILFVGGFGYAAGDRVFSLPEALQGQGVHKYMVERDIKGQAEFIRLMKLIVVDFDAHCIVRPHPGERLDNYKEVFGDKVEYCKPEPAIITLNRSDIVIHSGSTIGYEAHLMGMPGFNYKNSCEDVVIGRIHKIYQDAYKLCADLKKVKLGQSNANQKAVDYLEKHYQGKPDGKACVRAVAVINSLPDLPEPNVPELDKWPKINNKHFNYESDGVLEDVGQWACAMCKNIFFTTSKRNLVKCPYCGVICVKYRGEKKQ